MRIQGFGFFAHSLSAPTFRLRPEPFPTGARRATDDRRDLVQLAGRVRDFRGALAGILERLDRAPRALHSAGVSVRSGASLGLQVDATVSTLRSREEINTVSTSYSPLGPQFAGSSSVLPTLDGVYDGQQGDDVLTFRVSTGGVVGLTPVRLQVLDGSGQQLDSLSYGLGYSAGTPLTLSNGLTLALSSGLATAGDSFQVEVSASVGSRVREASPFDGVRGERPNFEPGFTVGDGSFLVNGVAIAVQSSDSILDVLARISASSAGVEATFDAASEGIVFAQRTPGASAEIELAGDTSGFLAATKLDGVQAQAGRDSDLERPIGEVPALAGISSGTFLVNGIGLTLDVAVDSLTAVLGRIESQVEGVRARIDRFGQRVRLSSARQLVLDDGGTGLFERLSIPGGTFAPAGGGPRNGYSRPEPIRKDLLALIESWNELFRGDLEGSAGRQGATLKTGLVGALRKALDGAGSAGKALGRRLGLDLEAPVGDLHLEPAVLDRSLRTERRAFEDLFLGPDEDGLLHALDRALEPQVRRLGALLDGLGLSFLSLEA